MCERNRIVVPILVDVVPIVIKLEPSRVRNNCKMADTVVQIFPCYSRNRSSPRKTQIMVSIFTGQKKGIVTLKNIIWVKESIKLSGL